MGEVYRATHQLPSRSAAIKVCLPGRSDPTAFEREGRDTARLCHPNTVTIFDFGRTADGTVYCVMEHLDGLNLQQLALIAAGLSKDPERRPASAEEFRRRLRQAGVEPWSEEDAREWWRRHP